MQAVKPRKKRFSGNELGEPHPFDRHVGKRLRLRRTILGVSQERLAEALGLTFQQVQKYERGMNRISASRLYEIARALAVPMGFFLEDYNDGSYSVAGQDNYAAFEDTTGYNIDPMQREETLKLVKAYYRISDPLIRQNFLSLLESYTKTSPVKNQEYSQPGVSA